MSFDEYFDQLLEKYGVLKGCNYQRMMKQMENKGMTQQERYKLFELWKEYNER